MFNKLTELVKVLCSKPHDTSTEEGRSKERVRRIAQSGAMGMIAKIIQVLSGLVTVPLTLPYLGVEQFGLWMALTGFVAFLVFSDFGLSIGLKSTLARCFGTDDKNQARNYISTAFMLLMGIALLLVILAFGVFANLELHSFIKLNNPENQQQLRDTAVMLLLVFAFGMPSAVIHSTLEAYQCGAVANTALAIGRLMSLVSIFFSVYVELPLSVMASLYMGLPLLSMYFCGVWLFTKNTWMRPKISCYDHGCAKEIFSIGKLAVSAQLGASIMSTGPLIVFSSVFGAAAIAPYVITKRMFDAVTMLLSVLLSPLWPAYGEALARKNYSWILQTFKKSLVLSMLVFVPIFIFLSLFGQDIIYLWTRDNQVIPSWPLLMMCNIWIFLLLIVRVLSVFLIGLNQFKGQAMYGFILPSLALLLGLFFSESLGMTLSILLMIFVGEFIRILFMSVEVKGIMTQFKNKTASEQTEHNKDKKNSEQVKF